MNNNSGFFSGWEIEIKLKERRNGGTGARANPLNCLATMLKMPGTNQTEFEALLSVHYFKSNEQAAKFAKQIRGFPGALGLDDSLGGFLALFIATQRYTSIKLIWLIVGEYLWQLHRKKILKGKFRLKQKSHP